MSSPPIPLAQPAQIASDAGEPSAFHRIDRAVPEHQLPPVSPDTPAQQALEVLERSGVTHLAVGEHPSEILGAFSYRSFAEGAARRSRTEKTHPADLPIEEYLAELKLVGPAQSVDSVAAELDKHGAVLVHRDGSRAAIATIEDLLRYLRRVARPFILLQEIELGLRALLRVSFVGDEFATCTALVLARLYIDAPDRLPTKLIDMSFGDYVALLQDGRTWDGFPAVASAFGGTRERAAARLRTINELRNDVFHFRRELGDPDYEALNGCRSWLDRRVRVASRRAGQAPAAERA
jgi:CBS domain-containing protein